MPDLVLTPREQAALRSLYAYPPVPGHPMPTVAALELIDILVPSDGMGGVLADDQGNLLEMFTLPTRYDEGFADDEHNCQGALSVGIMHWARHPHEAAACGAIIPGWVDGVSIGFRNGRNCVSQLFIDREKTKYSERDLAMLHLICPALQRVLRERPTPALPVLLTVQERRVLMQVAAGLSNADIAAMLFVAPSTVRKHLENSYRKLGVTSRLAAVAAIQGTDRPDQDLLERLERLELMA